MTFDQEKLQLKKENKELKEQLKVLIDYKDDLGKDLEKLEDLDPDEENECLESIEFYQEMTHRTLDLVNKAQRHYDFTEHPDLVDAIEKVSQAITGSIFDPVILENDVFGTLTPDAIVYIDD